LLKLKLSAKFDLYFHQRLSPNDENISFGQIVFQNMNYEL
jgi:hydrogenase maturation factor HypF (carbamoyltransferase family)